LIIKKIFVEKRKRKRKEQRKMKKDYLNDVEKELIIGYIMSFKTN
jgi:hypothetical protein